MAKARFALLGFVSYLAMGMVWPAMGTSYADMVQRPIARAMSVAAGHVDGSAAMPIQADLVEPADIVEAMARAKIEELKGGIPTQRLEAVAGMIAKNSSLSRQQARPLAAKMIRADERMRRLVDARVAEPGDIVEPDETEGRATAQARRLPDTDARAQDAYENDLAFDGARLDWVKQRDVSRLVTVPADEG